jgi:hypothetical protein
MFKNLMILGCIVLLSSCQSTQKTTQATTPVIKSTTLKIATFNVSMEATNYVKGDALKAGAGVLKQRLKNGDNLQIKNIAEIIQRTRPDIVLLNEFDYIESKAEGVKAFIKNYLNYSQNGVAAIDYPYFYYAPVNTGLPTEFDLDNNGTKEGLKADAQGFGFFHGHYGMMILSKFPIQTADVRTFQHFLRADMPGAIKPFYPKTGEPWYSDQEWQSLRLSSKSHWDVPVLVNGKVLHLLASHPVPPVFDGDEDRNGARNHDEIRLWTDYITPGAGDYIVDDKGEKGGLSNDSQFVLLGDQNAAVNGGNARKEGIGRLLASPWVNSTFIPQSEGARQNKPENLHSKEHTSAWGMRVDYVLPSANIKVLDGSVFWPTPDSKLFRLVADRKASSDHRLVWLEIKL